MPTSAILNQGPDRKIPVFKREVVEVRILDNDLSESTHLATGLVLVLALSFRGLDKATVFDEEQ